VQPDEDCPGLPRTDVADRFNGGEQQWLWSASILDERENVRPSRVQFLVARRHDRFTVNVRVGAF
jgi:hypothetical protein